MTIARARRMVVGGALVALFSLGACEAENGATLAAASLSVTRQPLMHVEEDLVGPTFDLDGAAEDHFGWGVAISGDTAAVTVETDTIGGTRYHGSVYVFVRSGVTWDLEQKISAGEPEEGFAEAVALDGDTLVIGARTTTVGSIAQAGAVYVFTRSGGVWTQQQRLVASDPLVTDLFGRRVAIWGDTLVVSSTGANRPAPGQGAVYVFSRSAGVWTEQQKLLASDGVAGDSFGIDLDLRGDDLVIGASGADIGGKSGQGAAYVFVRSPSTFAEQGKLIATDGLAGDAFGSSVAIEGDDVAVGAPDDDFSSSTNRGSAYVFRRATGVWAQHQKLTFGDDAFDHFGNSVAMDGGTLAVGSYLDQVGATTQVGSVTLFINSGATWDYQGEFSSSDGASNDRLGSSVALSGDTVLTGAYGDDVAGNVDQGSAYVFLRTGTAWAEQAKLTSGNGADYDYFGYTIAISGDTAIVGDLGDNVGDNANQGAAYVFIRNGTQWDLEQRLIAPDGAAYDVFGVSVAISGETVVVGAEQADIAANANQGAAYVFTRTTGVWTLQQKLVAADGAANHRFGGAVSIDGNSVAVGAYNRNSGQGAVYVYTRTATTWTPQQTLVPAGLGFTDYFGRSVAIDADTLIGGSYYPSAPAPGAAYVFTRTVNTWTLRATLGSGATFEGDGFGVSVALDGDTAVVGANLYGPTFEQGAAYVFVRNGLNWLSQGVLIASDGVGGDELGWDVAISGDRILAGASQATVAGGAAGGAVYVFERLDTTWSQELKIVASDGAAGDELGWAVAVDGITSMIAAPSRDGLGLFGNPDEGVVYFGHLGCATDDDCVAIDDCHDDGVCTYATGLCTMPAKADGEDCDDGDACSQTDTCQLGVCTGTNDVVCSASDSCHGVGVCDPGTGLCSDPPLDDTPCDDGLFCTTDDTCNTGTCIGAPRDCSTGVECVVTSCDEVDDLCEASTAPEGTPCDDGLFCTDTDACSGGNCIGAGDPCSGADGDADCSEVCDEVADACSGNDPNGSACNDALYCNGTDTCEAGVCGQHSGDPCEGNLADGDADCAESCDEATDSCAAFDEEGSLCAGGGTCVSGVCAPPAPADPNPAGGGQLDAGCGCGAGTSAPAGLWGMLLALGAFGRRRRVTGVR